MKLTTKRSKVLMKMTKLSNHSKVNSQYKKREFYASMFCVIRLSQGFRKARSAYISFFCL